MHESSRTVDFLTIPAFMVEIERIRDHSLKGRPVAIAPLKTDQAKIWEVSLEAYDASVLKGMELAVARRLCRDLKVIDPNPDIYRAIHNKLLFKSSKLTPIYEEEKLGKIFLDFTGFERLYGDPQSFGLKLITEIGKEFSLRPRLGIAENKLVSKAATHTGYITDEIYRVFPEKAGEFLRPFPHRTLPVVKEIYKTQNTRHGDIFEDLNLSRVEDLQCLDLLTLRAIFPKFAAPLYEMSRGIDTRVVAPPMREDHISVDLHLSDTNDREKILSSLYYLADKAFEHLRSQTKSTSEIKIALRYADFKYLERVVSLPHQIEYSYEVYHELKRSLSFLFARRTMVRYLLLELRKLNYKETQLSLFESSEQKVFDTLDQINKKFPDKVFLGRILR